MYESRFVVVKKSTLFITSIALVGTLFGPMLDNAYAQKKAPKYYSAIPESFPGSANPSPPIGYEPCVPPQDRLADVSYDSFDGVQNILGSSKAYIDAFNRYGLSLSSSYYINDLGSSTGSSVCICVEPLGQYCRPAGLSGSFCAFEIKLTQETIYLGPMLDLFMKNMGVPGSQFAWGPQYCTRGT